MERPSEDRRSRVSDESSLRKTCFVGNEVFPHCQRKRFSQCFQSGKWNVGVMHRLRERRSLQVAGPRPWSSSGSSTWLLVFQIISRDLLLVTVDNVLSDFILNVYFSNVTN